MSTIDVGEVPARLGEVVSAVSTRGERVTLLDGGTPVAVLVHPRDLRSLVESVEMLTDGDAIRRIAAGDAAFQSGDVLAGTDLGALDPQRRYAMPSSRGPGDAAGGDGPWDLAVSGPAQRSLAKMPQHLADLVVRFLFERLTSDPVRYGNELRGGLSRRWVAHVETERVVYRLDSVKRSVRVLEILHGAGIVGQPHDPGRRF